LRRKRAQKKKTPSVVTSSKGERKMSEKVQFWTTFILALIGALAWTPMIWKLCTPGKIHGKIISRYNNLTKGRTHTMFLYKLAILCTNKPFHLSWIKCEIEDLNGNKFYASANNMRAVVFTQSKPPDMIKSMAGQSDPGQDVPQLLLVSGDEYLNNFSLFPANKSIVGYLLFNFEGDLDRKLRSTTFIFESFDGKTKKLKFKESDIHRPLFWDDTIWQTLDPNAAWTTLDTKRGG
jgi:hypothetical protein